MFVRIALVCAAVIAIGCGSSGPVRYDVSGTVTFDGQPVPVGTITFVPVSGNTGPGGSAGIEGGRFDTAATGKGPTGGPHVAIITGFDGKTVGGIEKVQEGSPLFIDYREEVDLPREKAVRDFTVPGSARLKATPPPPPGRKA
ncbi:MAG: hypothetical protein RLZZ440_2484 [Planctomycetota bacterium]